MEQIQIRNLSFSYPDSGVDCLKDVSLSIEKGEFVLLCGASGCGKTTLLRHLKSVLTPRGIRSGAVLFRGTPLDQVPLAGQSQAIGFVMQNPDDQIVTDKVWHELAFGLENLGVPRDVIGTRVAEMASFFGIQSWYHREVSQLSGGQKQLLNLASIMAMQPEILILDEPTGQLDPIAAGDFLNTLKKINRELGITVLITEHRAEEIFPAADRVLVMDSGRLIVDAPPRDAGRILMEMENPLEDMLPAPMRIFCKSGAEGQVPLTVREGRNWLDGIFTGSRPTVTAPAQEPVPAGAEAVKLTDVWFRYDRRSPDVLKGLTLSVPQGCLYAIVGSNGGGKSTALRTVCGICRPYRGKVEVLGKELKKYPPGSLFENCLTMLPQDPRNLFVKQSVAGELGEMNGDVRLQKEAAALCEVEHLLNANPYDCPAGSSSGWPLPRSCLQIPGCCCWTNPPRAWIAALKGGLPLP